MKNVERLIQNKARELGYENCGIVPLEKLGGYGQKMRERVERVPESEAFYQRQHRLVNPQELFPWAQSVVIAIERYGKYTVPTEAKDRIGKHYLFDARVDERTKEFKAGLKMERFMRGLGLRFANERKFGLVGLRWAAMTAGLGTIRRNNFFYTKSSGSWVTLQGWLIDQKLELIEEAELPKCPDSCNRCIKACPSNSLSAPFTMSPTKCVSFLTTFGGKDLPNEPLSQTFGKCIYGCDICQEVCPINKGKWVEDEDFPGIPELSPYLTPEEIMKMDDVFYKKNIQPKFFYLGPDDLWKWQVDALNFMRNNYERRYEPYILLGCKSNYEKVRDMADFVCKSLHIGNMGTPI